MARSCCSAGLPLAVYKEKRDFWGDVDELRGEVARHFAALDTSLSPGDWFDDLASLV